MKRLAVVAFAGVLLVAVPLMAVAHPLGNFTINQYLGIAVSAQAIAVDYVLDMAEIPAFQEQREIDTDGDEAVSLAEEVVYLGRACPDRAGGIRLILDGTPLALSGTAASISFPPGQAGLSTLRLECSYGVAAAGSLLEVVNSNYEDRLGWREIVISGDGVVVSSTLLLHSPSDRLTSYPKDPAATTPDIRAGTVSIGSGTVLPAGAEVQAAPNRLPVDALGSLIGRGDLGAGAALIAVLAAMTLGAGHALAPGHGKTIMAAYLVGNRGTLRHALGLGLAVAVSHTVGVLALGVATLVASRTFQPERVYPYLSAASGLIVLVIGIGLGTKAVFRWRHETAHHHGRDHDHQHDHRRDLPARFGWKALAALGLSGGLVPSASAVVLLLGAVNLGQIEFGLALIGAFGLGMAAAMVSVGLGLVVATRFGLRQLGDTGWFRRLTVALPAAMAAVVMVVGVVMLASAGRAIMGA